MTDRVQRNQLARRLAAIMQSDEQTATNWLNGVTEVIYQEIKSGRSVTLSGLGGFYVKPKRPTWVFKFNPGQRLRAVFGWSSNYKGKL
jgi:DNA-binding protein HU-beta